MSTTVHVVTPGGFVASPSSFSVWEPAPNDYRGRVRWRHCRTVARQADAVAHAAEAPGRIVVKGGMTDEPIGWRPPTAPATHAPAARPAYSPPPPPPAREPTAEEWRTCVHEAAHGVVGHALGFRVTRLRLCTDDPNRDRDGDCKLDLYDENGPFDRSAFAVAVAAGAAADRLCGHPPHDEFDRQRIAQLIASGAAPPGDRPDRLVRENWPAIHAVATELGRRRQLDETGFLIALQVGQLRTAAVGPPAMPRAYNPWFDPMPLGR